MKYLLLISLLLSIGCGSTSVGEKTKTLNSSNLIKGQDGIYRLKTEVVKINNGLVVKDKEQVISVNKQANYSKGNEPVLPPKLKAERDQHPVVNIAASEKSESPNAGILTTKEVELTDKPMIKINWGNLLGFYGLMVWIIFTIYYIWKPLMEYKNNKSNPFKKGDSNPFKKNDPDTDSGSHI